MSKEKTKAIQAAIAALGLQPYKDDMVSLFTKGRTTHVSEMTDAEKKAFILHLNGDKKPYKDGKLLLDKKRKRIISTYRQMAFEKFDEEKRIMKADMVKIEADVVERWGKKLNEYNSIELGKIIAVLEEKILPWYLKKD